MFPERQKITKNSNKHDFKMNFIENNFYLCRFILLNKTSETKISKLPKLLTD